ncbi:GlmL-related ornithine degradation protein [Clostridium senegalense]|uniref:DNA mismatch repair protein MutL n=1 Tax=Clostridium senegalense TaxID=1465809 RepID=A0A6M0GZU7_9CLOT|nr:GlmL-related ornithine degradation protein [Clostridium senegalense]NEU03859.1 DNA mismatch repair protein MutL [Clostridium senegalense]
MKVDYLVAEIGSTTTLVTALSFTNGCEIVGQGKAFTTVLDGDVTIGLKNAIKDIENAIGESIQYKKMLATSSAAGGLKITVHGLVEDMTVKAAREAALGAGGIIKMVTAGKLRKSDIKKIKKISPNLIMIAGGTDYGERDTALYNSEIIKNENLNIPIVYCGNTANVEEVKGIFEGDELYIIDNVYPRVDEINVEPARKIIQEVFERNIVKAPGMEQIRKMVDGAIMTTPGAVMEATKLLYENIGDLVVIDVGGATTDVHSVTEGSKEILDMLVIPEPKAKRTVEGDLGVYINSVNLISNLSKDEKQGLTDVQIQNNIKPIPDSEEEKKWSSALCKKAVELAIKRHIGVIKRSYGSGKNFLAYGKDLSKVKYIIGTGGALTRLSKGKEFLNMIKYIGSDLTMHPKEDAIVLLDKFYIMALAGVLSREDSELASVLLRASLE